MSSSPDSPTGPQNALSASGTYATLEGKPVPGINTKPLFKLIDWLYRLFGNFGVSILIVTVLLKLVFFPLANKSYDSMSKMKKVQPEMLTIK